MKFKVLSFIFLIIAMAIVPGLLKKHKHRRAPHENNKYYRWYWGIVTRLLPKGEKNKEQCLPPNWANKEPSAEDQKNVISALTTLQGIISRFNPALSKEIEKPCKNTKDVISFLTKKLHVTPSDPNPNSTPVKSASAINNKQRLFHQKLKSKKSKKGEFGAFNSFSPYFNDLLLAISGFYSLPLVKDSGVVFNCLKAKYPDNKKLKDQIEGYLNNMLLLEQSDEKKVTVLVNSLCNWHKFKRAIYFLNSAFKQTNGLTMWQGFGYFFGRLSSSISNA